MTVNKQQAQTLAFNFRNELKTHYVIQCRAQTIELMQEQSTFFSSVGEIMNYKQ